MRASGLVDLLDGSEAENALFAFQSPGRTEPIVKMVGDALRSVSREESEDVLENLLLNLSAASGLLPAG